MNAARKKQWLKTAVCTMVAFSAPLVMLTEGRYEMAAISFLASLLSCLAMYFNFLDENLTLHAQVDFCRQAVIDMPDAEKGQVVRQGRRRVWRPLLPFPH